MLDLVTSRRACFHLFFLLSSFSLLVHSFILELGPRKEECVYEASKPGHQVYISFQVIEGRTMDVDIKVRFLTFLP